jgi:hypothetical protein
MSIAITWLACWTSCTADRYDSCEIKRSPPLHHHQLSCTQPNASWAAILEKKFLFFSISSFHISSFPKHLALLCAGFLSQSLSLADLLLLNYFHLISFQNDDDDDDDDEKTSFLSSSSAIAATALLCVCVCVCLKI